MATPEGQEVKSAFIGLKCLWPLNGLAMVIYSTSVYSIVLLLLLLVDVVQSTFEICIH